MRGLPSLTYATYFLTSDKRYIKVVFPKPGMANKHIKQILVGENIGNYNNTK